MATLDEGTETAARAVGVLARVPLRSIRTALQTRANDAGSVAARHVALALASQGDAAAVPALMCAFAAGQTADLAEALAALLQPGLGVDAEDLRPGLAADDEMTRLWTAIAIARVQRRDGSGPDFEPLEQVWDALVRSPSTDPSKRLFDGVPPLFHGDPAWAAAQLARVRPLPAAVQSFILQLKDHDFDGWTPRRPESAQDSGAVRAFVAGITGAFDIYGNPLAPEAQAPVASPPATDPTAGTAWLEDGIEQLAVRASERAATDPQPPWVIGNEVLDLALQRPHGGPVAIGRVLSNQHIVSRLPRDQLAWALGRTGEAHVVTQVSSILQSSPAEQRAEWIDWMRDIAVQIDTPAPKKGGAHAGGGGVASTVVTDLIDDVSTAASFLFQLRGEKARGAAICAHSEAKLEFRYELPTSDVLALVDHPALNEARSAELDIMLELTARGNLTLRGARRGIARFDKGAMVEPVIFALAAGKADEADSAVHVDFIVKGETVYQQDLAIAVVADEAELERYGSALADTTKLPGSLLDDAASAGPPPEHRVRMTLALDADGFRIDLIHWVDGKVKDEQSHIALGIDRARLEALVTSVGEDLASCYAGQVWRSFDGVVPEGDAGRAERAALLRTLAAVAAAGSRLNDSLREDDDGLALTLDYIEKSVPDGAVITIATDEVFLPWEILYPRPWSPDFTNDQKARYPIDPTAFWGVRFAIETLQQHGSGSVAELRSAQTQHPPKVSINLNPKIAMDGLEAASQPLAVQQAWADRLKAGGQLDGMQDDCTVMRRVLQDAASDATLIYVYCHGSAPHPFGGHDELLQLDADCKLSPRDLRVGVPFPGAPIVFLNSCQSAAHSPLAFSSFLKEFRRRGALGMIAASFPVPIVFGAHFGVEVVERYLQRSGSLAVALQGLRRTHLLERGNPVPLFYALQCQISFAQTKPAGAL